MGARLFAPGSQSTSVGCIVMAGHDFPEVVLRQIRSWNLNLVVHEVLDKPSTRGLLKYTDLDFGRRSDVLIILALALALAPRPSELSSGLMRSRKNILLSHETVAAVSRYP